MTVEEIVNEVFKWITSTGELLASEAFKLAIRQVYSLIAVRILWGIVSGVFAVKLVNWTKKLKDADERILLILGATAMTFVSLAFIINAIQMAINPEWYAIREIVTIVRGG